MFASACHPHNLFFSGVGYLETKWNNGTISFHSIPLRHLLTLPSFLPFSHFIYLFHFYLYTNLLGLTDLQIIYPFFVLVLCLFSPLSSQRTPTSKNRVSYSLCTSLFHLLRYVSQQHFFY